MVNIDIVLLMAKGELIGINLGDRIDLIISKLGTPEEIEEYSIGVYLHYNNVRFLFEESCLVNYTVFFYRQTRYRLNKSKYIHLSERVFQKAKIKEDEIKSNVLNGPLKYISKKTTLNQFIVMLQYTSFKWEVVSDSIEYLSIIINDYVLVIFDLYTNQIERISIPDVPSMPKDER